MNAFDEKTVAAALDAAATPPGVLRHKVGELHVIERPGGRWAVRDLSGKRGMYLAADGMWSKDGRSGPEWEAQYWHDLDTATRLAREAQTQSRADVQIPDYLQLVGDENSGVELNCGECAANAPGQAATYFPIAYYGGHGDEHANGLPYFEFNDLDGLIRFAIRHTAAHIEERS
ncbi:hypothetical protein ABT369_28320 [Dactylosporangium sp. NPDC000244]|uniref:hypothetical protein n=1 Tax=Dactylosporangium sp. NPDC000244 TaxID=3154365 RepID=UPI00332D5497